MKKIYILLYIILLTIPVALAIPLSKNYLIHTMDASGNPLAGTFTFNLTISRSSDCLDGVIGKKVQLTVDSSGTTNITIPNVDMDFNTTGNYYLCYYRDDVLKETQKIGMMSYAYRANVSDSLNPLNSYQVNRIDATRLNTTLLNVSEIYINNSDISSIFATQTYLSNLGYYFNDNNISALGYAKNANILSNKTKTDNDIINNRTAIETFLGTRIDNNKTEITTDFIDNIDKNVTKLDTAIANNKTEILTDLREDINNNASQFVNLTGSNNITIVGNQISFNGTMPTGSADGVGILNGTAAWFTNANASTINVTQIYGNKADPVRIGSGTDSQSLTSPNDLFVTGNLEVDNTIYAEGTIFSYNSQFISPIIADAYMIWFEPPSAQALQLKMDTTFDQFTFAITDHVGRQIVIGDHDTSGGHNYDHATQTNPTLYIHSVTAPNTDNTQWMSFAHNKTVGYIDTGKGAVTIGTNLTVEDNLNVIGTDNLMSLGWGNLTGVPTYGTEAYTDTHITNNITGLDSDITNNISRVLVNNTDVFFTKIIAADNVTRGTTITLFGNKTSFNSNITGNRSWNIGLTDKSFNIDDNGTSKIFIENGTGNIGIGTTNPAYLLQVADTTGAGLSMNVSDVLYVNGSSGNVGIGTTGPDSILHLYTATGPIWQTFETDDETDWAQFRYKAGATNDARITAFGDTFPDNPARANTFEISLEAGAMDFVITKLGTEFMRIKDNGNVGINTTSPKYTLQVAGTINATKIKVSDVDVCLSDGTNCVGGSTAGVTNGTDVNFKKVNLTELNISGDTSAAYLHMRSNATGNRSWELRTNSKAFAIDDLGTNRFYIENGTGNVGIGTTSPTTGYKLDVRGPIIASGESNLSLGYGNITGVPAFAGDNDVTNNYTSATLYPNLAKNNTNAYFSNLYVGASASPYGFALTSTTATSMNISDVLYVNSTGKEIYIKNTNITTTSSSNARTYTEYWNGSCHIQKNLVSGSYVAIC